MPVAVRDIRLCRRGFDASCLRQAPCSFASALLGSIPWGVIISRAFFHTDIREHGSGNIGTTNAMRTMGKKGGVAVFVLDFGKGVASGLLALGALWLFVPGAGLLPEAAFPTYDQTLSAAFLGCVLGHIFSPWLDFKGGKGHCRRHRLPVRHLRRRSLAARDRHLRRLGARDALRIARVGGGCASVPVFRPVLLFGAISPRLRCARLRALPWCGLIAATSNA